MGEAVEIGRVAGAELDRPRAAYTKDSWMKGLGQFLRFQSRFNGFPHRDSTTGEKNGPVPNSVLGELPVDMKDASTFNPRQVQVTRWKDGTATRICFYYDPAKLSGSPDGWPVCWKGASR